jgi:hypothetical protein
MTPSSGEKASVSPDNNVHNAKGKGCKKINWQRRKTMDSRQIYSGETPNKPKSIEGANGVAKI